MSHPSPSKPTLITTGLHGLVGSKFAELYGHQYDFENIDLNHPTAPVDITQADQVRRVFEASAADSVIHLAAYTDVDGAWKQKDDKLGVAYQVNVVGTQNVAAAAAATNKHLIHISTGYVFDGEKTEMYTENDPVNPIEWYGYTKAQAEEAVQNLAGSWSILRIDFPFRSDSFPRPDLARKLIGRLQANQTLFDDHYFGPTYLDDFAKVLDWNVRTRTTGLFHATAGEQWSDYALAQLICEAHQLPYTPQASQLSTYLATLGRPYQRNTAMDTSKLRQVLDCQLLTIPEAIAALKLP